MDTTVPDITFGARGSCNYCAEYFTTLMCWEKRAEQNKAYFGNLIREIRSQGKNKPFDSIIGLSGGLDSCYALYCAKKIGLRPLAVHLDNGWNSEVAVHNIEKLCKALDIDLCTHVIDWEEFRELQLAFFRANVVDIEILTDHAIRALLYATAKAKKTKYIITGTNFASEGMRFPSSWSHYKNDLLNIRHIYRCYGKSTRIRTFPTLGLGKQLIYRFLYGIRLISLLDYTPYSQSEAKEILSRVAGWQPYEKKHYESIFTRFYQGFILPQKFGIDKRRVHLSTLICSGQIARNEALEMMKQSSYTEPGLLASDRHYILKKLNLSEEEFCNYLAAPAVPHGHYLSEKPIWNLLCSINDICQTMRR